MTSDEAAFLRAIQEQPDNDSRKLVYADWLEEQGDARAEFVRLLIKERWSRDINPEIRRRHTVLTSELAYCLAEESQLRIYPDVDPGRLPRRRRIRHLRAKLIKLSGQLKKRFSRSLQHRAASFDPEWLAVISDPVIENCGKIDAGWAIGMVCDRSWSDLKPTDHPRIRRCEGCGKNVQFFPTQAEAQRHCSGSRCIAVPLTTLPRRELLQLAARAVSSVPTESDNDREREDAEAIGRREWKARHRNCKRRSRRCDDD